jgi:gas vesicle protein
MPQRKGEGETISFVTGLIMGFIVGTPIAAWLSPRSGQETRQGIRQRGVIIRYKAGQVIRKPATQIGQIPDRLGDQINRLQDKIGKVKGESIEDALAEGKAIAAQKKTGGGLLMGNSDKVDRIDQ